MARPAWSYRAGPPLSKSRRAGGSATRLPWQPAISGVRGLAIVLVLAFHAGVPILSGGVVGVTLFFVLSGYLITSLLIAEREVSGGVDLRAFVDPPCSAPPPGPRRRHGGGRRDRCSQRRDSVGHRGIGPDIGVRGELGSRDGRPDGYVEPRLVTEHRGAVLPCRAARVRGADSLPTPGELGGHRDAGGARGRLDGRPGHPGRLRGAEGPDLFRDRYPGGRMLAGCALAASRARWPAWQPGSWLGPVAMVTLLVVAAIPLVNPFWSGSGYTIAVVASLGVVVSALRAEQRWTGLSLAGPGWLGERSYSLYLVHVPVFMMLNEVLEASHPALRAFVAVGLSGTFAVILYQYVERPFRRPRTIRESAGNEPRPSGSLSSAGFERPDRTRVTPGRDGCERSVFGGPG